MELIYVNLNVLKLWLLKFLRLITRKQPTFCRYNGLNFATHCEEFALPEKRFCETHYQLERRFHRAYHFIDENGRKKYLEIGILYGDKNYSSNEWNKTYKDEIYKNRNILIKTELTMRHTYAMNCAYFTFNKQYGNQQWENYLMENETNNIDCGLKYNNHSEEIRRKIIWIV